MSASSPETACHDWSKCRIAFGPMLGSPATSNTHGCRRSASRDRHAIAVIAARQSAGSSASGTTSSSSSSSTMSASSSSFVRT